MASKKKTVAPKGDEKQTSGQKKIRKWKRIYNVMVILLGTALVAALVIVLSGFLLVKYYYEQTDYVPDEDVTKYSPGAEDGEEGETLSIELYAEFESIEADRAAIEAINIVGDDKVYNILLIGLDLRVGETWNGNSDSMILVSINSRTKKITMTSFMRDLYTIIPGVAEPKKLNYAHALGGGPLLVETIEQNYRIDIDNYASVNFYDMIAIIDSMGGLDIEISEAEAAVANKYYIDYLARETGVSPGPYYITGGGVQHLNGLQAVAYARIRYVGNADYERTERQRKVMSLMFEKMKNMSLPQLNSFLEAALPRIRHNVDGDKVNSLLLSAVAFLGYDLVSNRVPYDGYYTMWNEMLVPDFSTTITRLHGELYGGPSASD